MYHQTFFGLTCAGILAAAGLLPLPDRETLPEFSLGEFEISDLSLSEPAALVNDLGALVSDLPEIGARIEERILRPRVSRVTEVVDPVVTPDAPARISPEQSPPEVLAKTVNFELDTAELDAEAKAALEAFVQVLRAAPTVRLGIYGHTDLTGPDTYNISLGQARAERVAAYLTANGIAAERIEIIKSYGETAPVVNTSAALRENRRVQIDIL